MIALSCPSCQKGLSVKEELAGKKVKCPGCGHVTPIPAHADTPPSPRTTTPGPSAKLPGANFKPFGSSRRLLLLAVAGALVLALVIGFVVFRARHAATTRRFTNSLGMEFVLVPRGEAWLAEGDDQAGLKEVDMPRDFYLGVYEVTQEEWQKVMGKNPSQFQEVEGVTPEEQKRFPVESVTWPEAREFAKRVNEQANEAGWEYRLPTEEEWEYACRGGPMTAQAEGAYDYYLEKPSKQLLPGQANFGGTLKRPCKVGSYAPNRLGLYDMHGNVWEWCEDELNDAGASRRVNRGGSWYYDASFCRAASRWELPASDRYDNLGLRLARVPAGKDSK